MTKPKRFRKKPVEIDAIQWTGHNVEDIADFMGYKPITNAPNHPDGTLVIDTLEGDMAASVGDWIICGVQGEYYPCKPDIFAETYEEVSP